MADELSPARMLIYRLDSIDSRIANLSSDISDIHKKVNRVATGFAGLTSKVDGLGTSMVDFKAHCADLRDGCQNLQDAEKGAGRKWLVVLGLTLSAGLGLTSLLITLAMAGN